MQKNVASQKWVVFAFDRTDNTPKTGDAANITANIQIDFAAAAATNDTNPTELEDGYYSFDLTQAETNGDQLVIYPASSTADIQVIGVPGAIFTTPDSFPDDVIQTGDTYALANGAAGFVAIDTVVDSVKSVTDQFNFSIANQVDANAVAISGDTTAADNLELQYDTTGLTGDTFPATQSQIANITNTGAAVNTTPDSYTLTTGTQSSGTVSDTAALDGTNHEHTDTAGVMELYYEFNIGAGSPASVTMTGYLTGNNDVLDVYGYDWVAAGWVQIGTLIGKAATTNEVNSYDLFVSMVGTGANSGVVRVRFYAASGLTTATLAVDQIFCSFNQGSSIYDGGAVWLDTGASNTNTVVGIDGVSTNPVSTIAAANTLATALNINRFMVAPGSSITFAASQQNQVFQGDEWTLALGGQDIAGTKIVGADVTGIGTGSEAHFEHCDLGNCTLADCDIGWCALTGTITASAAGDYYIHHSYSGVAGAGTPVFDFGAAVGNTNLNVRHYSGGLQIDNKDGAGTDLMSLEGNGQLVVSASSGGAISLRGSFRVTNTGGATITYDDVAQNVQDILTDTGTAIPAILGSPAGADMSTDIAAIKTDSGNILTDTNELQGDWTNGGRLDLILDAILAMLDDARAEPGQGAPPVNPDAMTKLDYIYKFMRNRVTTTATTISVYDDAGTTVDHKSTHSDDATTYDRGEFVSGP